MKKTIIIKSIVLTAIFYLVNYFLDKIIVFIESFYQYKIAINEITLFHSLLVLSTKIILILLIFSFLTKTNTLVFFSIKNINIKKILTTTGLSVAFIFGIEIINYILSLGYYNYDLFEYFSTKRNFELWKIPLILSTIIFSPIIEELFFRGYILTKIKKYFNPTLSILISSLLFTLVHLPNIDNLITIFIGGYLAGITYIKFENIFYPTFFHILWNSIYILTPYII